MDDKILVVKMNTPMSAERLCRIYMAILTQVETGVVVLPCGCDAMVVPKDIEIRVDGGHFDEQKSN